ncbi:MAG: glutamate mutase L [Anaerolineae bacterium]|nr:glutamate mutase L [Anaerolineae bacterium]
MAAEPSGSILAVDFGNVLTRAILIDLVDGVYRLVARGETRSTIGFPSNDARVGLRRVVQQISEVTGRKLLTPDGRVITPESSDRSGVDDFVMTASIGRTLRTVIIGLVPEVSVASSIRATGGTYVEIVETFSLDDPRSEQEQLNALVAARPDLVFIAGGSEDGAQETVMQLARLVKQAIRLMQGGRSPNLIYAGNSALVPSIRVLFGEFSTLFIAPNVRPSADTEDLDGAQLQLALAYNQQRSGRGGFGELGRMTSLGVLPTAQSYRVMAEYLTQVIDGGVLLVDMGSAVSILAAAAGEKVTSTIRTDIGLGHSADSLLHAVGAEAVENWLPFRPAPNQIRHYALNKTLRPGTVPETLKGLYLEHAFLKAGMGRLVKDVLASWGTAQPGQVALTPPFRRIIAAGSGFTGSGHPGLGALAMLDAIQPTGVAQLQADAYGLIAALGGLAVTNPSAVVQVMESSSFEQYGVVVSVSGLPRSNRTALNVKITTSDGQTIKQQVQGGSLWVYPLPVGLTAKIDVRAGRGLNIGGKGRVRMEVEGGTVGIIFDARGRPLPVAETASGRADQIPAWIAAMTGDPIKPVDQSWLEVPDRDAEVDDRPDTYSRRPASRAGERRGLFGRRTSGVKQVEKAVAGMQLSDDTKPEVMDLQNQLDDLRRK